MLSGFVADGIRAYVETLGLYVSSHKELKIQGLCCCRLFFWIEKFYTKFISLYSELVQKNTSEVMSEGEGLYVDLGGEETCQIQMFH